MTTETEEKKELCVVDAKLLTKIRTDSENIWSLLDMTVRAIQGNEDIWDSAEVSYAMKGPLLVLEQIRTQIYDDVVCAVPDIRELDYEAVEKKEPRKKKAVKR